MFPSKQRRGAALVLCCLAAAGLVGCANEEDQQPAGATVGVLLTEDLGAGDWTGPWWGLEHASDGSDPQDPGPRYQCQVPGAARTGMGDGGRVAHAEAAWGTRDRNGGVVWSLATRYRDQDDLDDLVASVDREVKHCTTVAAEKGDASWFEAVVTGTPDSPVLDELFDNSARRWHVRSAWTTTPDRVFVQVVVAWHPDQQQPADAADLLPVAVQRAQTLPPTSPNPPAPPACEDC